MVSEGVRSAWEVIGTSEGPSSVVSPPLEQLPPATQLAVACRAAAQFGLHRSIGASCFTAAVAPRRSTCRSVGAAETAGASSGPASDEERAAPGGEPLADVDRVTVETKTLPGGWVYGYDIPALERDSAVKPSDDSHDTGEPDESVEAEFEVLTAPLGQSWATVSPDAILRLSCSGELRGGAGQVDGGPFRTNVALHRALGDKGRCVFWAQPPAAMALATLAEPLRMLHHGAVRFYGRIAYDLDLESWKNFGDQAKDAEHVLAMLGSRDVLIRRHRGVLITAPSVAEAFDMLHQLELSCSHQLAVMAALPPGVEISDPKLAIPVDVCATIAGAMPQRQHDNIFSELHLRCVFSFRVLCVASSLADYCPLGLQIA